MTTTFYLLGGNDIDRKLEMDLTEALINEGFVIYCKREGMTGKDAGMESAELDVDYTIFLFEHEVENREVSVMNNYSGNVRTMYFRDLLEHMEMLVDINR